MPNRYTQLIELCRQRQPKRILEVGTWIGHRAVELLNASPQAHYYGFDLFEDMTDELDKEEFNVKPHVRMDRVDDNLRMHAPGRFELYKGNTRKTLKYFQTDFIDFAFIDGGHSVETIESDLHNVMRLMKDGVIVLDDYYEGVSKNGVGCKSVIKDLDYEVLPQRDKVVGGGTVQLVKVEYGSVT